MLPVFKDENQQFMLMQSKWASELNPLLAKPLSDSITLTGINLNNGVTIINHLLGRQQQGWIVTDVNGSAIIFRSASFNNKTLTLTSNAAVTVNIMVF